MMERLSPDGRTLVILDHGGDNGAFLLDLRSLQQTRIDIQGGGLPQETTIGMYTPVWCPYDPDVLCVAVVSLIDTTGKDGGSDYVQNLFTYRVSTRESHRITPNILGPYGGTVSNDDWVKFAWLPGSSPGNDSIMINYDIPGRVVDSFFDGIYVPKTQALIPRERRMGYIATSRDGQHALTMMMDSVRQIYPPYILDGDQAVQGPKLIDSIDPARRGSFSPNGQYFAIWANPLGFGPPADTIFDQVWIYATANPKQPLYVIDFQQLFCKYSFMGIWPTFITDSTIAVSMHADGDYCAPLWELRLDGTIVRQLTSCTLSDVAAASQSVESFAIVPSISRDVIGLELPELRSSAIATVTDELGREVYRASIPPTISRPHIDVTHFTAGLYYCSVSAQGYRGLQKFVVQR